MPSEICILPTFFLYVETVEFGHKTIKESRLIGWDTLAMRSIGMLCVCVFTGEAGRGLSKRCVASFDSTDTHSFTHQGSFARRW